MHLTYILLATVAGFGFWLSYAVDSISIITRFTSGVSGNYGRFHHFSMVIMLVNRLAVALTMPVIGLLIDLNVETPFIVKTFLCSLGLLTLTFLMIYLYRLWIIEKISNLVSSMYSFKNIGLEYFSLVDLRNKGKLNYTIVAAIYMPLFGFIMPAILASYFSEYRAALIQSGFLLNSVGTILHVLFVEKEIGKVIDSRDMQNIQALAGELFLSRTVGCSLAVATLLIFLLVI